MQLSSSPGLRPVTIGLLFARIVIVIAAVRIGTTEAPTDDVARFQEIHEAQGVPYRDFAVEYAPLEVAFVHVVASGDQARVTARLAALAFIADIAAWLAVGFGWGSGTAERYLLLGTPLLLFMYQRFDLVPVAFAAWGAALAVRRWQRSGGLSMAAAIFSKLWPAVLVPAFLVSARKRALAWSVATTGLLLVVWLSVGGIPGISDVVTFRHATGWEVESTIGTVVWIATGGPIRIEAGAPRIGSVPPLASVALIALLVGTLAAVWLVAARRTRAAFGAAAVSAVATLIALSPTFSLQYVAWLLPWAAIAWSEGDRWHFRGVAAVSLLTGVLFVAYAPDRSALSQTLLVCRNALVIALPILWLVRGRQGTEGDSSTASAPGSVTGSLHTNR